MHAAAAQSATTPDSRAHEIFRLQTCSSPNLRDHTAHHCGALLAPRAADLLCTACARCRRWPRNFGSMPCGRWVCMSKPEWTLRFYRHGPVVPEIHFLSRDRMCGVRPVVATKQRRCLCVLAIWAARLRFQSKCNHTRCLASVLLLS